MKLLDFYTSLLKAVGLHVSSDHAVSVPVYQEDSKVLMPAIVDQKRLVLPTRENLNKVVSENTIVFHPMNEDLMRGPSKVLEYLREAARMELEAQTAMVALNILRLCASPELHAKLSPDQAELLDVAKKADQKTIDNFLAVVDRLENKDREKSLIHIYLRRKGKLEGKTYRQMATVTFPIYEQLAAGERTILGVKLRIADVQSIMGVFEYIFPGLGEENAYSYGSNSKVAPKLEAVIGAVYNTAACINAVIDLANSGESPVFEDCEPIDSEWAKQLGNFEAMINEVRMIPMQQGNEGEVSVHEQGFNTVDTAPAPAPTPRPVVQESAPQAPAHIPQQPVVAPWHHQTSPSPQSAPQAPSRSSGGVSLHDVLGGARPQPQAMQPPMGYPPQMPPQQGALPYPPQPGMYPAPYGYPQPVPQGAIPYPAPGQYPQQPQAFSGAPIPHGFGHNVPYGHYGSPGRYIPPH